MDIKMNHEIDINEAPAIFSPCRTWRYTLRRVWPDLFDGLFPSPPRADKMVAFIGLNPSTADEVENDPTVRRCINFAKRWGYGGMFMLNIFAYRSTDPDKLYVVEDPVGAFNDRYILKVVDQAALVIGCWGNHGKLQGRGWELIRLIQSEQSADRQLYRLGALTNMGQPRHPLYLKGDLLPEPL